ncbi:multiple sugar transport system substrate-binding protein [Actinopolyspora lacussalsi subsp. righensis]|uniref:Multiple sugar transport system substrate-binding protein n=1 Tax=Actinopolyspora righensis TaxID=995060 RepID=A0A1I6ZRH9_9ACTN|nr:extracellular solute-binding protein [Actinopolyspora righensis]SFT65304.1 multiple sugar transport system substrate-binding protein [Actinopolyspora righensis]
MVTFGLALLLVTAGCTGGVSSRPADVVVELDHYTSAEAGRQFRSVLDRCAKRFGLRIRRQNVPVDQLMPKVLRDATAHSLPDLLFVDNPDLKTVAKTGALTELSQYGLSGEGFYPGIVEAGSYRGKLYGLAPGVNGLALFYNRTMFERAGLEPPETWQEMRSAARELTEGSTHGIAFSALASEEGSWQFEPFLWSNGGSLDSLDSRRSVEALEFWSGLVEDGLASRSVVNWNQNDVIDRFAGGNAAMMINGSWSLSSLDDSGVDYGIVTLPTPSTDIAPKVPLGGEVGAIPETTPERQRDAARVLGCMLERDNMLDWTSDHAYVPGRTKVAEQYAADRPVMKPFVEEVATGRARTAELGPRYREVSQGLADAIQATIAGSTSPREALERAARIAANAD